MKLNEKSVREARVSPDTVPKINSPLPIAKWDYITALASLVQALNPALPKYLRVQKRAVIGEENKSAFRIVLGDCLKNPLVEKNLLSRPGTVSLFESVDSLLPKGATGSLLAPIYDNKDGLVNVRSMEKLVYDAFNYEKNNGQAGLNLITVFDDDNEHSVIISEDQVPDPMAFAKNPVLVHWALEGISKQKNRDVLSADDFSFDWVKSMQFVRESLKKPYKDVSAEEAKKTLEKIKELASFSEYHPEKSLDHGWIAFSLASKNQDWTEVLIKAGCDPHANYLGSRPLDWAVANNFGKAINILSASSVSMNVSSENWPGVFVDSVKRQLDSDGDGYISPLLMACYLRNHEAVSALLANGALPDKNSLKGEWPLKVACQLGDDFTARTLLSYGANPSKTSNGNEFAAAYIPQGELYDGMFDFIEKVRLDEIKLEMKLPVQYASQNQEHADIAEWNATYGKKPGRTRFK